MPTISTADAKRLDAARKDALAIVDPIERTKVLIAISAEEFALMGTDDGIEGVRSRYMDDNRAS